MAGLSSGLFRFAAIPTRPRRFGWRLLTYLGFSVGAWLLPPWGALATLALVMGLGRRIPWRAWFRALGWLWLFVAAPLAIELMAGRLSRAALLPAAWRSLTFLVMLGASQWLSATSTVFEIRAALDVLFRVFGRRAASSLSLAGALAICFIPWVVEQLVTVRQAGELRGLPARSPLLALRALTVPVFVRMIGKARHTAEALELRGR
ncbi:MAG: energy-coupling factor transporter transmembrane component T [Holophaga sp.]|nr:energy-coupling factor transporter transmembrane component T [Holophaga sp.]